MLYIEGAFDLAAALSAVSMEEDSGHAFDLSSPSKFRGKFRQYQLTMLAGIIRAYTNGIQSFLQHSFTGTGKTVMAARLAELVVGSGGRFLFVVDGIVLAEQTYQTFTEKFSLHCGIIQANNPLYNPAAPVQIATVQTLGIRLDSTDPRHDEIREFDADFICIDECHIAYSAHEKIRNHHKCFVLGLTATPMTKGLGLLYEDYAPSCVTVKELIDEGSLSNFKAYTHDIADLEGIKTGSLSSDGIKDFIESDAARRYTKRVIGDVIKIYNNQGISGKTLLFASTVAKAKDFAKMFLDAGIKADYIHAEDKEKEEKIASFKRGEIDVLCNVGILVKGFDYPDILQIFDCAPTKSVMRHLQKFGRLLRVADGKAFGVFHDCAGNIIRCGGTPDEIPIPQSLDASLPDEKQEVDEAPEIDRDRICGCGYINIPGIAYCADCGDLINPARKCGVCGHIKDKAFSRCPECGSMPTDAEKVKAVSADKEVMEQGDLVEYVSTGSNKKTKAKKVGIRDKLREATPAERRDIYAQMCEYSIGKYGNTGAAFNTYKALYSSAPPDKVFNIEGLATLREKIGKPPGVSDVVNQHFVNEARRYSFALRKSTR